MTEYEQYLENFNSQQETQPGEYEQYLKNVNRQEQVNAIEEEKQIQSVMSPVQQADPTTSEKLLGGGEYLANATALSLGDEIGAGVNAGLDYMGFWGSGDTGNASLGELYDQRLASTRGRQDQFREDNPMTAIGMDIAGSIPATIASGGTMNPLGPIASQTALGAISGFGQGEGLEDSLSRAGSTAATALALSSVGRAVQKPGTDRVINATAEAARKAETKLLTTRSLINLEKKAAKKAGKAFSRDLKARSAAIDSKLAETAKAIGDAGTPALNIAATSAAPLSRGVSAVKGLASGLPVPGLPQAFGTAGRLPDVADTIDQALANSLPGGIL